MNEMSPVKPSAPAIARAVTVMDLVAAAPDELTLAELSRRMKLAKSSVYSVCSTLTDAGLLQRNSDQTFAVGPHVMRWATAFTQRCDLATEFARIWDESTVELRGATITLTVLDENEVVYIAARNSNKTPWFTYKIGMRLPMAFTSTGHAFLTRASDAEIRHRYKNGFPEPMTEKSPTNVDELLALVAEARELGYTMDREYVSEGKQCYGAPILGVANEVVAAIAVSIPIGEVSPQFEQQIVETLTRLSRKTSERLGAEIEAQSNIAAKF